MANDLEQRLRRVVVLTTEHGAATIKEAADALARKDAEIAELEWESARQMNALHSRIANQRGTIEQLSQRAERAEARVREAPVAMAHWGPDGGSAIYGPKNWGGKTFALVRLDTEKEK